MNHEATRPPPTPNLVQSRVELNNVSGTYSYRWTSHRGGMRSRGRCPRDGRVPVGILNVDGLTTDKSNMIKLYFWACGIWMYCYCKKLIHQHLISELLITKTRLSINISTQVQPLSRPPNLARFLQEHQSSG